MFTLQAGRKSWPPPRRPFTFCMLIKIENDQEAPDPKKCERDLEYIKVLMSKQKNFHAYTVCNA